LLITLIKYHWKLEFNGKKFYLFGKKDELKMYKDFFYYCINHRNTKAIGKSDSKGIKNNIKINNSWIHYDKNWDIY